MNGQLAKYYNDIKDPQWPPNIETYGAFLNLPVDIQKECEQHHNLAGRMSEIEDTNYWRNQVLQVWVKDNLGYVPLPKCANTYYSQQFLDLGWKKVNIGTVSDKIILFGLVQDPSIRWLKGVVEFFSSTIGIESVSDQLLEKMFEFIAMPDIHSTFYHLMLGDYLYRINWIPMDILDDQEIKNCLQTFCRKNGQCIRFFDYPRINESTQTEKFFYQRIKELHRSSFEKNKSYIASFQMLIAPDLKFYRNLILKFDPFFSNLGN